MRHRVHTIARQKPAFDTTKNNGTCVHYWLIDPAEGRISRGVCKFCGVKREFLNSIPEYSYFDMPGIKNTRIDKEQGEAENNN